MVLTGKLTFNSVAVKTISVNKDLNDMVRLRLIKENKLEV